MSKHIPQVPIANRSNKGPRSSRGRCAIATSAARLEFRDGIRRNAFRSLRRAANA